MEKFCCRNIVASLPGRLPLYTLDRIHDPPEKQEKTWYIFYVIKPQGGLDRDVCGLGFSNYGNVPTLQIAIDSKRHKTTPLLFQFIATTQKTAP